MILEREFPIDERVEKEALSLIKAGHQVDIICFTMKSGDAVEQYKGITVIKRKISSLLYRSSIGALNFPFYFNFWKRILLKQLETTRYQVLHLHDLPLAKPVYALSVKYKCKFILDLHENYPALLSISPHTKKILGRLLHSDRQWQQYEKKYVGKPDALVTVVEEMRDRIKPFSRAEIAVVENTPYLNELKTWDALPDPDYITLVYSGGIAYHRGLQTVIEGLKQAVMQNCKIRLFILGTGSYENILKELVKSANLENHVHFFGWITPDRMFENIFKSDIALIPHIKSVQSDNSSPNKLYQYMFCGKPVLASNCNSVERVIRETGMGLTYIHNSSEDFKDKLLQLIDGWPFNEYIPRGRKALEEKYNWERSVRPLLELYDKWN